MDPDRAADSTSTPSSSPVLPQAPSSTEDTADALWSRLHLIEDQPIHSRATAYLALHDDLIRRLESSDSGSDAELR